MHIDRPRALSALITNLILSLGGIVFAYWLCYERPVAYIRFVSDGGWAGHAAFVAFLTTGVLIGGLAIRDAAYRKLGWLALAAGALFAAGTEIGWAQGTFGPFSPETAPAHDPPGRSTVHDFADTRPDVAGRGSAILLLAVLTPLFPRISRRVARFYERYGVPVVPGRALPLFLLAATIPFVDFVRFLPGKAELMELFLGLALAVMVADLLVRTQGGARTGTAGAAASAVSVVLFTWIATAPLVHFFGNASLESDLNAYAAFRFPEERMFRQSEAVFRYLGSHPEERMDDTTLNRALVYRRSGRDAEAEQVLRNALAEQEELQGARPDDPVPFRDAGRILLLLGQRDAATAALEKAAELDVARLESTLGGPGEWKVRWSLGKTYHALGYRDVALDEILRARRLAPDDAIRREISRWFDWEERRRRLVEPAAAELPSVAVAG